MWLTCGWFVFLSCLSLWLDEWQLLTWPIMPARSCTLQACPAQAMPRMIDQMCYLLHMCSYLRIHMRHITPRMAKC